MLEPDPKILDAWSWSRKFELRLYSTAANSKKKNSGKKKFKYEGNNNDIPQLDKN